MVCSSFCVILAFSAARRHTKQVSALKLYARTIAFYTSLVYTISVCAAWKPAAQGTAPQRGGQGGKEIWISQWEIPSRPAKNTRAELPASRCSGSVWISRSAARAAAVRSCCPARKLKKHQESAQARRCRVTMGHVRRTAQYVKTAFPNGAVSHRFEELSIRLNQPETAADPALFRRLMQEYHEAEPVVQAYQA